jgi:hypothetical protein
VPYHCSVKASLTAPLFVLLNPAASGCRNVDPGLIVLLSLQPQFVSADLTQDHLRAGRQFLRVIRLTNDMPERMASGVHTKSRDTLHQFAKTSKCVQLQYR